MEATQIKRDGSTAPRKHVAAFLVGALLLFLAVFAVYFPMIHGFFTWDDDWHVLGNPYLSNFAGLLELFNPAKNVALYFPVSLSAFWLERSFFGVQNPVPFHVVSMILHAANTIVLWRLLLRLRIRWATLAAAIFAIHPMHVETVAWISEQKTLLACLFTFAATWAYVEYLDVPANVGGWKRPTYYALGLVFFLLAILSKAVVCTLPVALLLMVYWRSGKIKWRHAAEMAPFLVLSGVIAYIFAMPNYTHTAHAQDLAFPWSQRIAIAGRDVWFYIGKILWPDPLLPIYPLWQITSAWWEQLPAALVVGMLGTFWALRGRMGRGPFVAIAIFIVTLSPALSFVTFSYFRASLVADHFAYPADVVIIVLCAGMLRAAGLWLSTHLKDARLIPKYWIQGVWIVVLGVTLGLPAIEQAARWGDQIGLWQFVVKNNDKSWQARTCLAMAYGKRGLPDDIVNAELESARSLKIRKTAEAFRIHATALMFEGQRGAVDHPAEARLKLAQAAADFREDMAVEPDVPDPCIRLGELEEGLGDIPAAVAAYDEAVTRQPRLAEVWRNLARCEFMLKQFPRAVDAARNATELEPSDPRGHFYFAMALRASGGLKEAIAEFRAGLELDPGETIARLELANTLVYTGQLQDALPELRRVVQERPDMAAGHVRLAQVLAQLGDSAGAAIERAATQSGQGGS